MSNLGEMWKGESSTWIFEGLFGGLVLFAVGELVAHRRRQALRKSLVSVLLLELKAQLDIIDGVNNRPGLMDETGVPMSSWYQLRLEAVSLLPAGVIRAVSAHYSDLECRRLWGQREFGRPFLRRDLCEATRASCLAAIGALSANLGRDAAQELIGDAGALASSASSK